MRRIGALLVLMTTLSGVVSAVPTALGSGSGRATIAHHAGARRILAPTTARAVVHPIPGYSAIEPTLGSTRGGSLYYTAMGSNTQLDVVRSDDGGRSWSDVSPTLPGGAHAHAVGVDPYLYVDPTTSRVFTIDLTVACSFISFSDSKGEAWTTNPLGCGRPINDHQTLFAGPPTRSTTVGYPNVVYYCFNDLLTSSCTKSLDGGIAFAPTGAPAFGGPDDGSSGCGGIHGHGVVGSDGTVYLPREFCGRPFLAISTDEGLSWKRVQVADKAMPDRGSDPSVAVDRKGRIYYAFIAADRLPYLTTSTDGGRHWSRPLMIAAPGVTETNLLTIDVGASGALAIAYAGSENSIFQDCRRDPRCEAPERAPTWNAYIATTRNALTERPVFLSAAATPPKDPIVVGACGPGRCPALIDFIDVEIAPDGTPWAAFVDGWIAGNDDASQAFVATLVGGA